MVTGIDIKSERGGGESGVINLQTKRAEPDSGKGSFEFCIVEKDTDTPVVARQFSFTIYYY